MNSESKAKHVPAPWSVEATDDSNGYVNIKMGNYFASFYGELCEERGKPTEVAMATARLIAEAPTMYELLRQYAETMGVYTPQQKQFNSKVLKLIKKIEG